MSSLHNQPVVEDIVSAFKTTQNQSWSMFNDKLGNIPIKDCKKKDIFKSENPIELSDEDIPVFGLVPRLEKFTLVSCNKCSMIVKRDCMHYHYNRRHNNPENDNFSLESFILPTAKTNKHKKQKINVRKLPEKKIIGENSDSVVQKIKTEFDQLEFERIPEVTQVKVKQEIKVEYVDECDDNLEIKSCIPSTSDVFDWTLEQCTQNIIHYADHKVNDRMTDCDKDLNKLSTVLPVDTDELQSNKCLADIKEENTIDFVNNSRELLSKSPDSIKTTNSSITIDFSGIMSDDEDYYEYNNKSKKLKIFPSVLQNNKEQTKLVPSNKYSDVNYEFSENITTFDQSSIKSVDEEQTKFSLNHKYSNVVSNEDEKCKINDNSQIFYHQLTSESLNNKEHSKFTANNKYLDVTSNNNSSDSIINYYQSTESLNIKEEFKTISNTKYSHVLSDEEENVKNNDNSKIVYYQLLPKVFKNKEKITYTPNCKYLNTSSDEHFSDSVASYYQSSVVSLNINEEYKIMPNTKYSDVVSDEKENYKINDNSKIKLYQLSTELPNNETQTEFSPIDKYSEVLGKKYSNNSVNTIDNSSKFPFCIKEETKLAQSNEYAVVMNNESSDDEVSSYDKSSIPLLDIKEKSKPSVIVNNLSNVVNDDYCYDTSNYEYYQLSSGYNNEALIPLSPSYNKYLDIVSDDEENDFIKDSFYQLPSVLQSNDDETKDTSSNEYLDVLNNESSDNACISYSQSQTVPLGKIEEKSKSALLIDYLDVDNNGIVNSFENEYYQLSSELINNEAQTSCTSSYLDISNDNSVTSYDQSSNASLDLEDINLAPKDIYTDYTSDSNDSVTSSNQSITGSQGISKDTKYTQTCIFLNHKQYNIDPITLVNVDESTAESLNDVDDKTKCTQTDLSLEYVNCYKITEDLIENCIPIDSNVEIVDNLNSYSSDSSCSTKIDEYSMNSFNPVNSSAQISGYPVNSFTPISSSAQIINNVIIPTSAEVNDFNHSVSNGSHYLSRFQKLPWNPESQNDHFSNRLTHGSIIDNFRRHEDNDKMYGSEPYIDRPKQNENIFDRNIINGSTTPYMDKNHITCRDRLKKTIDENIVYRKNCKPHTNNSIEAKMKKNLKRRVGGQVADGKENHNRWITGGFKKVKRVEFVVRKISYSDESDNNDNVDE